MRRRMGEDRFWVKSLPPGKGGNRVAEVRRSGPEPPFNGGLTVPAAFSQDP
jgi:hypothetical protein